MRNGGEHEGDGRSGCEQGVVAGPGCVLGQQIRAERPASRARGGGLTGACQGRIGVVVGFGWAGPKLEPPAPRNYDWKPQAPLAGMDSYRG